MNDNNRELYWSILINGQRSKDPRTMVTTAVTVKNNNVYCRFRQFTDRI